MVCPGGGLVDDCEWIPGREPPTLLRAGGPSVQPAQDRLWLASEPYLGADLCATYRLWPETEGAAGRQDVWAWIQAHSFL